MSIRLLPQAKTAAERIRVVTHAGSTGQLFKFFYIASADHYVFGFEGGNQALYKAAPTRDKADQILNQRLNAPFAGDANDHLYQWDSSRDYNPSAGLEKIQATVLAINSADDERNPPEIGVLDREIKRVKNGRVFLIAASENTAGHGTTGQARFWKSELAALLQSAPRLAP